MVVGLGTVNRHQLAFVVDNDGGQFVAIYVWDSGLGSFKEYPIVHIQHIHKEVKLTKTKANRPYFMRCYIF